jgi:hypothetical protein
MTIQKVFLGLLTSMAIGLMLGSIWNTQSKLKRHAKVEIGKVEIIHASQTKNKGDVK